jgi:hypothetical protein
VPAPDATVIVGIQIPSTSPIFLTIVGLHVAVGLACVVTGAVAMMSPKAAGKHPTFGTIYYWCLAVAFASATALAVIRWKEDYHLFLLGALSFGVASAGRAARRGGWQAWVTWHITGMGLSYIVLLTAFYVDNGKSLPLWSELPPISYWVVPAAIGLPLVARALRRLSIAISPLVAMAKTNDLKKGQRIERHIVV